MEQSREKRGRGLSLGEERGGERESERERGREMIMRLTSETSCVISNPL